MKVNFADASCADGALFQMGAARSIIQFHCYIALTINCAPAVRNTRHAMTPEQKTTVLSKISAEIERITADIKTLEIITQPVSAEDMDDITRMDSIVNKSVNEAALAAARTRLARLEYALKRINDPEFGYCVECGDLISHARLLAMPESTHCIDCAN